VPSRGSITQVRPCASPRIAASAAAASAALASFVTFAVPGNVGVSAAGPGWAPDSSARIASPGNRFRIASRIIASDRWSTSVTTSRADL
jgi:hypothetical protein